MKHCEEAPKFPRLKQPSSACFAVISDNALAVRWASSATAGFLYRNVRQESESLAAISSKFLILSEFLFIFVS